MRSIDMIAVIHRALRHLKNETRFKKVSYDGDHRSGELIITDRDGKEWILSSTALKENGPGNLTERLETLLPMAVKKGGTYDPDEIMCFVEEEMTGQEAEDAWAFLGWCHDQDKKFGSDTLRPVWEEWKESLKGKANV